MCSTNRLTAEYRPRTALNASAISLVTPTGRQRCNFCLRDNPSAPIQRLGGRRVVAKKCLEMQIGTGGEGQSVLGIVVKWVGMGSDWVAGDESVLVGD